MGTVEMSFIEVLKYGAISMPYIPVAIIVLLGATALLDPREEEATNENN